MAPYPAGVRARGPGRRRWLECAVAAVPDMGCGRERRRRCWCQEWPRCLTWVETPGVGIGADEPRPPRSSPAARGVVDTNAVVPEHQPYVVRQMEVAVGASHFAQDEGVVDHVVRQLPSLPGQEHLAAPVALVHDDLGLAHLYPSEELTRLAKCGWWWRQRYLGPGKRRLSGAIPHPPARRRGPPRAAGRGPPAGQVVIEVDAVLPQLVGDEFGSFVVSFLDGVVPCAKPPHNAVGQHAAGANGTGGVARSGHRGWERLGRLRAGCGSAGGGDAVARPTPLSRAGGTSWGTMPVDRSRISGG